MGNVQRLSGRCQYLPSARVEALISPFSFGAGFMLMSCNYRMASLSTVQKRWPQSKA